LGSVSLSNEELTRYSRQIVMPEVGPEGQRRLKGGSVLIVGMGGLGVPAGVQLASAGVGRIGVADADNVELPNLHRQFIYLAEDIGREKAEVAAERLARINPNVEVVPHKLKLDSSNAERIVAEYDVVVDATDNFQSRYLINDACVMLKKPDVYASVLRFDGQASVFYPPQGPCYRCLYPAPPPPGSVPSCDVAGVMGAMTGVMGSIQATQAVSLLLGKGAPLVGRLLVFDGYGTSFEELRIRRNVECPVCGDSVKEVRLIDYEEFCGVKPLQPPPGGEVDPLGLKKSLDAGEKVVLLDVREPYEYDFVHLEGAKLIPLAELPARIRELSPESTTVVYCHMGVRSARAVEFLRSRGFDRARNLKGGIEAWRRLVDPSIPGY
jgi:sulfur-carrier protein adenylyltransferase/sulfurtransferase